LNNALNSGSQEEIDIFIAKTQQMNKEIELEMHNGRDQLLELNSCRHEQSQLLIKQLNKVDQDDNLWPYLETVFDCYGVDVEYHSTDCHILRPSENLRISYFPMLPDDGITVTVNRDIALTREDLYFITREHPMVMSAMDLVLSSETGNATLSVIKHTALKAGQFLLEMLFIIECSAPAELKIGQFLPHTPIRILIDQNLKDVSEIVSHQDMFETGDSFDKEQIIGFINSQREHINNIIKVAEDIANKKMQVIITESNNLMRLTLSSEIKRLTRLRKINPGIKSQEIEQLKNSLLLSQENIKQARLRLDAIRFIITS